MYLVHPRQFKINKKYQAFAKVVQQKDYRRIKFLVRANKPSGRYWKTTIHVIGTNPDGVLFIYYNDKDKWCNIVNRIREI